LVGGHKSELGPVHSPTAVTIPFKNTANNKTTPKATEHTNQNQTKNTHQNSKEEIDRRSSSVTSDEKEVIALYQLRYWHGQTKKRENTETEKSHAKPDEALVQ
jgi:hypothetical protein